MVRYPNFDLKDFTAHSFRHSVASIYAASSEVTPKTLQTLLGHADIAATMNVYAKTETHTLLKAGKIFTQNLSIPVTTWRFYCKVNIAKHVDK